MKSEPMIKPRLTKAQKKLLGLKQEKFPLEAVEKIMLTKEAIASCALDGETQCGDMTIEPLNKKHRHLLKMLERDKVKLNSEKTA